MTDLPHDPLDELASAHLDGLTSPDEARRIEDDPALVERVARLRAARDAVRVADRPVDPERRELAIAAALAAADGPATAPVTSLAEVRARRGPPTWVRLVGAAAAVALAALLIPRLLRDDHDATTLASGDAREKSASTTTADPSPSADAGSSAFDNGATESGPSEPSSALSTQSTVPAPLVDLGTVADADALANAVRAEVDHPTAPAATLSDSERTALDACVAPMEDGVTHLGGTVLTVALASLADLGPGLEGGPRDSADGRRAMALAIQWPDRRVIQVALLPDCYPYDTRNI
jgi:hypothetical protein